MLVHTSPWKLATWVDVKHLLSVSCLGNPIDRTTVGSATQVLGLLILMRLGIILRIGGHSGNSETCLIHGD